MCRRTPGRSGVSVDAVGEGRCAVRSKLHELRDRVEERLLAHLDGLVVGGSQVAQRLLMPALCEGLPGTALRQRWRSCLRNVLMPMMRCLLHCLLRKPRSLMKSCAPCVLVLRRSDKRDCSLCLRKGSGRRSRRTSWAFSKWIWGRRCFALFRGDDSQQWLTGLHCLRYRPRPDCESLMVRALRSADVAVVDAGLVAAAVAALPSVLPLPRACRIGASGRPLRRSCWPSWVRDRSTFVAACGFKQEACKRHHICTGTLWRDRQHVCL